MKDLDFDNAIAIVGMALRVPGANNLSEYWQNLSEGRDCGRELSKDDVRKWGVDEGLLNDPDYVLRSYEVDNIDMFDAKFFGISPREARTADPQLRMSLETTYESIEDSGHDLMGKNVGFYYGVADHKYWMYYNLFQNEFEDDNEVAKRIVAFKDFFATQISHKLGLEGPSISMSSACSTGLLAVHEACNHLMMYDCDYAIAGGCEIFKRIGYKYMDGGLSSRDGYLRAFDKDASGTVFGSGVGTVVLRRFSDALKDGDRIYSVIHATAVNNDGNQKVGYMAPGVKGQMGVIQEAMHRADVEAKDISYVETHGTGTKVGDPIEINSISQVYRRYTDDNQFCAIGSVKTNLGHLSMAGGIASIIKVSLMLYNRKLVPSLHFNEANPAIDFEKSPFYVNTQCKNWYAEEGSRRAGISSFGVGGTNVHAIVGEAPVRQAHPAQGPHNQLLTYTAKGSKALQQVAGRLAEHLKSNPQVRFSDVAYTHNLGRHAHHTRSYIYATSNEDAIAQLEQAVENENLGTRMKETLPVVFMFPGQGSQYVNAGRELYQQDNVYKACVDECAEILHQEFDLDIMSILHTEAANLSDATDRINRTEYAQICLFVNGYAMAKQWMHWGVEPSSMIGHSIGEYAAACLADVFSLRDCLKVVYHRGRLMQSMVPGSMLSVMLPHKDVEAYLNEGLSVSVVNSAYTTVVSGETEAITALKDRLTEARVKSTLLHTSHAFHSSMMEPMLAQFREILQGVYKSTPQIPVISNVSGQWLTGEQATSSDYWVSQLRQAVLFAKGIDTVVAEGSCVFLEMGPGAALTSLVKQGDSEGNAAIRTMRKPTEDSEDFLRLYSAVGEFFSVGGIIDWQAFYKDDHGDRVSLPSYPFQHESYWLDEEELRAVPKATALAPTREHPLLGNRVVFSPQVIVFENTIDSNSPDFVNDHRLLETVIFPGAGFTQMALAIGKFFAKNKKLKVDDIRFANALMLHENQQKTIQIIAMVRSGGGCSFEILSKNADQADDSANWLLHAKGRISLHSVIPQDYPMPELMYKEGAELIPLSRYYDALRFITFGPKFRPVKRMWIGQNESLGWCELPEALVKDAHEYSYHPVLLDAAFQVIDGPRITESGTLPVGLKNFTVYDTVPNQFYVHALRDDHSEEEYSIGEMTIFSEDGRIIAKIEHYLQKQIADSVEFREQLADVLFEIEWKPSADEIQADADNGAVNWLLVGTELDSLGQVQAALESNDRDVTISAGERYNENDFKTLLADKQPDAIVFARGLDKQTQAFDLSIELLNLVKALAQLELSSPSAIYILTRGAQVLRDEHNEDVQCIHQAALWGIGNTITVEHQEFNCIRIDLDNHQQSLALLMEDLLGTSAENQIMYRQGKRYIPRLERFSFNKDNDAQLNVPNATFDVRLTKFGTFDGFSVREFIPDIVNDDEVQVEMHSAALNFKETLYVLGYLNPNNRDASDFEFGMEGAGRIKRVGKKITHLKPGDNVIVWDNGCLRSDFVVNASRVIKMPSKLSYKDAACIPTVYMTAYHALYDLAKLKATDKVLIHAAAGGVGQVSIQIAKAVGAEIYATASEGKWDYLREQGVKHIYNSRNLDFAEQIMADTQGQGVDVVFNSLAGNFITRSFDVLAQNGRFIDIGKTDIWTKEQAADYRADVFYHFFEVGEDVINGGIGETSPINRVMTRVLEDFENGSLIPMPTTEFELRDLPAAYRYLSAGKNIGKVVINLKHEHESDELSHYINADQTYLITGGLGGLGLLSAAWLIEHGAKYLVLTSRRAPNKTVRSKIDDWGKVGVKVKVALGDVGKAEDVTRIMHEIEQKMPELGGVMHCAGLLQDGVMTKLSEEQFSKSFAPKVEGSWLLHEATKDKQLSMFVFFSSVSAIFDGGGQANYAAANAYMDRLAAYRKSIGLPGLSVNWGGWADVGMAANLATNRNVQTELFINKEEAFMSLERLLVEQRVQGTVCKLGDRLKASMVPLLLSELVKASYDELGNMTEVERVLARHPNNSLQDNMEILVSEQVAKVLGLSSAEEVNLNEEFVDLGVDSLSMTELKNAIQHAIGKNLKMAVFFANSSVSRFAKFLVKEYGDTFHQSAAASLQSEQEYRPIEFVQLVESKAKDTLFCIPGLNSNVFDYMNMAEAYVNKYSLHIGQVSTELENLETDIAKIAASGIEEMRKIQALGPYALVGYSYGGVICLEIASQLRKAGIEIKLLMMIDSFPHFQHKDDKRFMQFMSALITDSILAPMALDSQRYAQYAEKLINAAPEDIADFFAEVSNESSGASRLNLDLLDDIVAAGEKKSQAHYLPPPNIEGLDISFVRADNYPSAMEHAKLDGFLETEWMADDVYGWGRFVQNNFNVTRVDANHNTLLKQDGVGTIMSVIDRLYNT